MFVTVIIIAILVFWVGLFGGFLVKKRLFPDVNNIEKARVYVETGGQLKIFSGKRTQTNHKGSIYSYGQRQLVFVPENYPQQYIQNKRVIGVSANGKIVASPLGTSTPLTDSESETLIKELVLGNIGSEMLRAMETKASGITNWLIAGLIGLAIGGIIVFGLMQYNASRTVSTPASPVLTPLPAPDLPITPIQLEGR